MNNDSCRGYVVQALKNLNYKLEEIEKVIDEMHYIFDVATEQEAETIYFEFLRRD